MVMESVNIKMVIRMKVISIKTLRQEWENLFISLVRNIKDKLNMENIMGRANYIHLQTIYTKVTLLTELEKAMVH
jgi:hypothetical protein